MMQEKPRPKSKRSKSRELKHGEVQNNSRDVRCSVPKKSRRI